MNQFMGNSALSPLQCGANFSFIFRDSNIFLPAEYKALQSLGSHGFVRCAKMLYNGNFQLYYLTAGLQTFNEALSSLDANAFLAICLDLLNNIAGIKQACFLTCQNIVTDFDHIYVDPSTHKTKLLYLPLRKRLFESADAFESEFRTQLVQVISRTSNLASPQTIRFSADLSNGFLSLEEVSTRLTQIMKSPSIRFEQEPSVSHAAAKLTAINEPEPVTIHLTKDNFLIGKRAALVDGVVSFNSMISRVHCRITLQDGKYYVTDMKSANGTFVNDNKLTPGQPCAVKNGDIIRLANSGFRFTVEKEG